MSDEEKKDAPDQPATEQSPENQPPENLPAETGEIEVVGQRTGMFGVKGTGDTSGYGGLVKPTVFPGAAQRPYGGWFDKVADGLDGLIDKVVIHRGEITFHISPGNLVEAAQKLRDDPTLRFELASGVSGVHYPDDHDRELHAVYHLLSMTWNRRIRLEVAVPDGNPHIPSLVAIYPTLDWHERETWDFFGIQFDGHPALTRIEMPDDWPGHPQRKDYPLGGIPVEYKGGSVPPPDQRRSYS
ncbi:NADH dehydrogenase [Nocardioides sp. Soil797]|nr:NADH dehydrogenase [Nocardioides sp. Soil797]